MRSMNSPLPAPQHDIDSIEKLAMLYNATSPSKKELLEKLNPTWIRSITAVQFGDLISRLEHHYIPECYHLVTTANPSFLKDAGEFTQICAHLDPEKIILFCKLIEQRLHTRGFIDNPTALSAIFSVFSVSLPNDDERQIRLGAQQLFTVYNILKPTVTAHDFFRTLDDFINLFPLIPRTQDKIALLEQINDRLSELVKAKSDVNHIHQKLKTSDATESELFKKTRDRIFRIISIDQHRSDKAFHAMLFLILDNYPGKQPEKLKSIIETVFSDPSITELNTLLEKTENAMRFLESNITSTRLQNALKHLIANLRTEEKKIDVDHIIQLAKSKAPIIDGSFFSSMREIERRTTAEEAVCAHEL